MARRPGSWRAIISRSTPSGSRGGAWSVPAPQELLGCHALQVALHVPERFFISLPIFSRAGAWGAGDDASVSGARAPAGRRGKPAPLPGLRMHAQLRRSVVLSIIVGLCSVLATSPRALICQRQRRIGLNDTKELPLSSPLPRFPRSAGARVIAVLASRPLPPAMCASPIRCCRRSPPNRHHRGRASL